MTDDTNTVTPILATIRGEDLLSRLDKQTERLTEIAISIASLPGQVGDHETRIRLLERRIWVATGAASAIGAAVGWGLQLLHVIGKS